MPFEVRFVMRLAFAPDRLVRLRRTGPGGPPSGPAAGLTGPRPGLSRPVRHRTNVNATAPTGHKVFKTRDKK